MHRDSASGNAPPLSVGDDEVRAFRARRHHLDRRLAGVGAVSEAAAVCGVQDSPPGSAAVALHARVAGLREGAVQHALDVEKDLVRTWAMRGAPYVVPTADLPVFTAGVLPPDERARTHLVAGVEQALDRLGGGLDAYVAATADVLREVLTGRRLDVTVLGREVAERIAPALPTAVRTVWESEGPYAPGQPLGEAVVHFCLRILTLRGLLCFAPREGRTAPFVLVDEWLGDDAPRTNADDARRALVTRHLRAYGPSTPSDLAAWLGVAPVDAVAWWRLVETDLVPVDVDGRHAWLHSDDRDALTTAAESRVEGVRLLPPSDPFLQQRPRAILVADRARRRRVWPPLHAPGVVLVDGHVAGTWRGRRAGTRLDITVSPFEPLPRAARAALAEEADDVARVRGATSATVTVDPPSAERARHSS